MEATQSSSINEKKIPLTFGSIISFSSITDIDSFVYVDGFVKHKIHVKKFKDNNSNSNLIYSKCLFQIYPTLINTNKRKALKYKKQEGFHASNPIEEQKRIDTITELQDNVVTEFKINLESFKKVIGQPVTFGQSVQFLHIASNKFLSYSRDEAKLERQNYQAGLDEYSNEGTVFKFLPCYKHQKDSEGTIFLSDSVYIASISSILNKVPYLHISNPIAVNINKQKLAVVNSEKMQLAPLDKKEATKKKIKTEVNVSLESQTRMKMNYYSSYIDTENNYLECGDVVWLNHSELAATLVCVTQFKNENFTSRIEFDGNRITDHFKQFIGNTNGMWMIEHEDYQKGGLIQWDESYRFKHIGTGSYLAVKKIRGKGEQEAKDRIILESQPNEDNKFVFVPVASTLPKSSLSRQFVTRDTFALIMHKKTKFVIHGTYEKDEVLKKFNHGDDAEASVFGEIKPFLATYSAVSEQAAFKVIKANFNEVWETNFLISCFPLLKRFLANIMLANKKGAIDKLFIAHLSNKVESTSKCVEDLDKFCNNKQFNSSPDQKYGEVNTFRQKLLREQYFIDILVTILKEMLNKDELELFETYKNMKVGSEAYGNMAFQGGTYIQVNEQNESKGPLLGEYARKYLEPKADRTKLALENLNFVKKKVQLCHHIYSLLKSICKENYENEIYTYNLIPQFLIQCKYLPEAVDCVMSIIQKNEYILTKLNENVKMNIDSKMTQKANTNVINIIINIKNEPGEEEDEENIKKSQALKPINLTAGDYAEENDKKSKISKPVNLINFFLNLLKGKNNQNTNAQFLTFFRNICCKDRVGLTINQDLLYKIFNYNPNFVRSFMITFQYENDNIEVEFPSSWTEVHSSEGPTPLAKCYREKANHSKPHIKFLEEQLNLYSDLALSRNYLWKVELEKNFPPSTVFNMIWDRGFSKPLKAAMCKLALTLYIDHEPFEELNLPRMCRVYEKVQKSSGAFLNNILPNLKLKSMFSKEKKLLPDNDQKQHINIEEQDDPEMKNELSQLIEKIMNFFEYETEQIKSDLEAGTQKQVKSQKGTRRWELNGSGRAISPQPASKAVIKNNLDDALLLNVTQLFSKLISFDALRMAGRQGLLYQVVSNFIQMLEYDPKHLAHSFLLDKLRKTNIDKRKENIKKKDLISISGFKNVMGSVVDNFTEITGTLGDLLSITQQKAGEENKRSGVNEMDEQNTYNNPTMRSMLSLLSFLERLKYDEDDTKDKISIKVKLEICNTLDFLLDMRKNYLISNFLAWFQSLEDKLGHYVNTDKFDEKIEKRARQGLSLIMPAIPKTGILDLDEEFAPKAEEIDLKTFTTIFQKAETKKTAKFTHFIENAKDHPDYVPDLDTLLLGVKSDFDELSSDVLPSLLISFLNTKDTVLESRLLDVVMRIFNQRTELLDALQNLEVLFDPVEKRSYEFVERQSAKLKGLTEKLEVWLGRFIDGTGGDNEIIQVTLLLEQLTMLLDTHNSVERDGSLTINDEKVKTVSESRQNIMKYLETYKPVLTISKNGLYALDKIILDEHVDEDKKRILVTLFVKSHFFLQQFCKNNETNQSIMAPHCDTLLRYAHLDVGQVALLCSIYEGNRFLCETIPDSFLTKFINLIENEGRQAHFLRLLKIIQKVDTLYIPENQIRVLRSLVSSDESDFDKLALILYASHDPAQHEFMFEFDDYLSLDTEEDLVTKLAQHGFKDTYRDQPFVYHAQLLDLLTDTIRGTESFNMSKAKLKRLFSFDHLLDLLTHQDSLTVTETPNIVIDDEPGKAYEMDLNVLRNLQTAKGIFKKETTMGRTKTIGEKAGVSNQKARGFSIIKSKVVDFLIELYLNASTKVVGEFSGYQNSFEILIEKEITRLELINDETRFEPEFFTYFFKSLLTLLDCYASKVLGDSKHTSDFVKGKSNTLFYKFLSTLMQTLPKFKKRLTYEQKENLAAFLNMYAKILKKENDSDDEFGFLVTDHEEPVEVLQPLRFLSDDLSPSPMSKKHAGGGVWATKDNWVRLLDFFDKENPKCEAALDEEKIALSKAVVRFTEIFSTQDKDEHRVTIESKDIIKKFIKYLQYGFSNKAKKETMISTLQTLKQMVDKEDPKERQKLQNMVDSYDGTKMLLTVLSDSSNQAMDTEILNHFLELGIKLLEGGNTRIQKNIYHYFITFQRSEVLFSKLHSIITSYSNGLKRNSKASKTGDVETPIEEYAQTGSKLLENTLRLLQLFTEGHYLDLQNYIRYQTNSRNNYDMVAAVTELLRSYLNHMNQANYESIMRCLDTLAEFVQGPCPENQVGLIDGKFFDVATAILTDYGKKAKKTSFVSIKRQESNLFDLSQSHTGAGRMHKWMIARLKYKTLVLVLSLIEMRKDSSVIKRIMRSLSVDVLKRTLAKVWKRYKGLYGTKYTADALGHHEEDPRVVPKETDPKQKYNYYDVITEAGFAAYFLLETYYEVNDFDADRDVVNDVMIKKMQSNTKKDNIFQASIIGQFGSFGVSVLKQGFDMANLLKNQVNNNLLRIIAGGSKEEEQKIMKEIELKKLVREGMKFFAEHSAHIEVLRNKRPETVHFYLPPHCHFLPKEIKTNFNDSVDRSNIQTKASGLTQSSHEIIRIMEHEEKLDQFFSKNKFVALFATHVNLWKDLAFFVTLIVNFFIISSYSTFFGTQTDPFYQRLKNPRFWLQENWDWTFNVIWILGIIMAVSSIFVVVFFMLKKIPLIISQIWYKPPQTTVQKKRKKGVISRLMGLIAKIIQTMVELLMTPIIVYYILYGTFALLGVIVHPFFLTFHLTEILVRYPTLRDVIRAFWDPRKSLLLTLMLFIVAEYFFSLIAYYFLYEDYAGNCDSTLLCFLYTFDYTFKANGGIGGQLESLTEREPGPYRIGRFFFDNIFNIAVVIVLVAIVAGIIIDTFGSLREKDKEKMDDLQEICFTCGCDRETYDRKSDLKGGFTRHIKIDHYMWNYVHYIAYLKSKDPTDYTGIESYINDKLKDGDVSWFPNHKAIMLDNAGDEDAKHEEEITYIDESCQETKKVAKNLINTLRIIRKKLHVKH